MKVQILKSEKDHFEQVAEGSKRFEFRVNDRDYQINDILVLMCVHKGKAEPFFNGDLFVTSVDSVLSADEVNYADTLKGNVILSLSDGVFVDGKNYQRFYYQEYSDRLFMRLVSTFTTTAHVYEKGLILRRDEVATPDGKPAKTNLLLAVNKATGEWAILSISPAETSYDSDKRFNSQVVAVVAVNKRLSSAKPVIVDDETEEMKEPNDA